MAAVAVGAENEHEAQVIPESSAVKRIAANEGVAAPKVDKPEKEVEEEQKKDGQQGREDGQNEDGSNQSLFKVFADALDELIGVKDNPHKLIVIINVFFGLLIWTIHSINGVVKNTIANLPPLDPTIPHHSILQLKLWELTVSGIRRNALVVRQNLPFVHALIGIMFFLTIGLMILTNIIGIFLIRDARMKKNI